MFDASGNYVLCVALKEKTPPEAREAAFAAGKRKGDELWARAMALRPAPTPVQIVVPVIAPPAVEINVVR